MVLGAVINRLIRYCGLSRYFYAARGHLGFGAKGLQEGDLICVLPGSQVPVLLWKSSPSCYHLVSTCFVLGLMDGEAAERLGRGDAKCVPLKSSSGSNAIPFWPDVSDSLERLGAGSSDTIKLCIRIGA
jgi:hypothetical protein